jgi:hypothetical protein
MVFFLDMRRVSSPSIPNRPDFARTHRGKLLGDYSHPSPIEPSVPEAPHKDENVRENAPAYPHDVERVSSRALLNQLVDLGYTNRDTGYCHRGHGCYS